MNIKQIKIFNQTLPVSTLINLTFLIGFLVFATVNSVLGGSFTGPTTDPPNGNAPISLNEGPTTQTKTGGLNINGNVGIGTTGPEFKLSLDNDGGIIAKGTYGSGTNLTTTGAGTRLMWYPKKAAFRAGFVNGTQWNDGSIGPYSTAMGRDATASGSGSTAMGVYATASGLYSTAMGYGITASGDDSTAMGLLTTASGSGSTAMGVYATASGSDSTAMGLYTTASGFISTAMGLRTLASGNYSTAMGAYTTASGPMSTAMGHDVIVNASATNSFAANVRQSSTNETITDPYSLNVLYGATATPQSFSLQSSGNAYFSGNVGIGTTTPGQKLQVAGNIQADRIKFPGVGGNSAVGADYYAIYQESGPWTSPYPDLRIQYHSGIKYDAYYGYGGHQFYTGYDGTSNPAGLQMQITDKVYIAGNVGIGTRSPQTPLDLTANTTNQRETSVSASPLTCGQVWDLGVKGQVTRVVWNAGGGGDETTTIKVTSSEPVRKVSGVYTFTRTDNDGTITEILSSNNIENIRVNVINNHDKCYVDFITVYYVPF